MGLAWRALTQQDTKWGFGVWQHSQYQCTQSWRRVENSTLIRYYWITEPLGKYQENNWFALPLQVRATIRISFFSVLVIIKKGTQTAQEQRQCAVLKSNSSERAVRETFSFVFLFFFHNKNVWNCCCKATLLIIFSHQDILAMKKPGCLVHCPKDSKLFPSGGPQF